MKRLKLFVLLWYNKSEYCQSRLLLLLYSNRALCWPWHSDVGWKAILQIKTVERFPLSRGHTAAPPWWKDATLANKVSFFFSDCAAVTLLRTQLWKELFLKLQPRCNIFILLFHWREGWQVLAPFIRCKLRWLSLTEKTITVLICFLFTSFYPAVIDEF